MNAVSPSEIRRIVIQQSKRANVGHIGSALSVAEILSVLYGSVLRVPAPGHPDRDRFILSKGHASLALYAVFRLLEWIDEPTLDSFCGDGTLLGVHPEHDLPGVDFSTGSLGHGITYGVGAALAAAMQEAERRVFVLVSDAECNEGALWEAVMFAAHHRLSNLVVVVDKNNQQALGYTSEVLSLEPLTDRWRSFGWDVQEVDGHDTEQLRLAMERCATGGGPPHVILANTTFGKGVSYMESRIRWHYMPMSDGEYEQALAEIGAQA